MRDMALLAILVGLCWLALLRPWLGVVGLALLGAMHPQSYGGEMIFRLPMFKVLFLATCFAVVVDYWRTRQWPKVFWDWRLVVLGLLFADFVITTQFALLPDTARGRLLEVSALVPPLLLMLWLIDTREKLHYLIVATAAGIALIALKGGYWAVMTGFGDRVYGPPDSQIGGNNEFAVALAMIIPLLVLWLRQTSDSALRWAIVAAVILCYIAALTSWSRGGLVSLTVMSAMLVWHSKHKFLAIIFVVLGMGLALVNLPETWLARMETISAYQQDLSFQGRQEAWKQGLSYLQSDPWTGSGFEGWRAINAKFHGFGDPGTLDWHSAYVEVVVEHGIPGFLLWSTLLIGTIISLSFMIRRGIRSGESWAVDHGAMLRASLVAYGVGGITLGITYWELMFQILVYSAIALRLSRGSDVLARIRSKEVSG